MTLAPFDWVLLLEVEDLVFLLLSVDTALSEEQEVQLARFRPQQRDVYTWQDVTV